MMGSGGMIVMDEDTCVVDIAKYFTAFLEEESCGKCVPCREGLKRMREILERISEGNGREGDIEMLEHLADIMKDGALCALGQTAPNPVLSTIKYFRDEYEAHINEQICPAGVCTSLIAFHIKPDACRACMLCFESCPVEAINGWLRTVHIVNLEKCIKCGSCLEVCPPLYDAIIKVPAKEVPEPAAAGTLVPRKKRSKCY